MRLNKENKLILEMYGVIAGLIAIVLLLTLSIGAIGCAPERQVVAPFSDAEQRVRAWVDRHTPGPDNPNRACLFGYHAMRVHGYVDIEIEKLKTMIDQKSDNVVVNEMEVKYGKVRLHGSIEPTKCDLENVDESLDFVVEDVEQMYFGIVNLGEGAGGIGFIWSFG